MKTHTCIAISCAIVLTGAIASTADAQTFLGDTASIGSGWLRSYVEYTSGAPVRIGVQMNQAAFAAFASADESATLLSLPSQAPAPFNHLMVDWNPEGHPGPGYNVPHFDFHFYLSTPDEVAAIPFSFNPAPVDPAYVPSNYMGDFVVVPQMGQHYFDLLAPEFNGGAFTETFIYGYNEGSLTFLEPMITYATLQTGGSHVFSVRQPSHYERGGYYPTEYGFSFENGIYDVFVGGLVATQASPVPEPSTYGALGALALLGVVSWRRSRILRGQARREKTRPARK